MSSFECSKCKNNEFEASIEIIHKMKGILIRDDDRLVLIPRDTNPMHFRCHQLKCAQCGERVEPGLIQLKYQGSDLVNEDELIFIAV